jgi:hypothetical protein
LIQGKLSGKYFLNDFCVWDALGAFF